MADLSIINILPNRAADIFIKLKSITSKLHNISVGIAFIKKALFIDVMSTFAVETSLYQGSELFSYSAHSQNDSSRKLLNWLN